MAGVPGRPRRHARAQAPDALDRGAVRRENARAPLRPRARGGGLGGYRGHPHVRRRRPRAREPRGGPRPDGRRAGLGARAGDAAGARADGAALRVGRIGAVAGTVDPTRRDPRRLRAGVGSRPSRVVRLADGRRDPDGARARDSGVRGDGGARALLLLPGRLAGDGGDGRGLPPDLVADAAGDPAADRLRLRARREPGITAAAALLQVAAGLDAGRPRRDRDRGVRPLHHLHGRLRHHRDRRRRPGAADAAAGRLPRGLLARARDRGRQPGPAVPAEPAGCPLQRGRRHP